jgi:2-C-methyl-D-erythritol 4-phosphate cytidylyltransferase
MNKDSTLKIFDDMAVVVAAAGVGKRFSKYKNKLFVSLENEPVFIRTLKNIIDFIPPENIFLSINPRIRQQYIEYLEKYFEDRGADINIISGGQTRMHSVYNAIKQIPESIKFTAVHDAARPYADYNLFRKCLMAADKFGSAVPAKKITDTIKRSSSKNFIIEEIDRENVWAVETPQIFLRDKLLMAYQYAFEKGLSSNDDAGVMEYSGFQPYIVENTFLNKKITFADDIVPGSMYDKSAMKISIKKTSD